MRRLRSLPSGAPSAVGGIGRSGVLEGCPSQPQREEERNVRRSSTKKYEIYSGRRVVTTQLSVSPLQAVVDYVRSYGVKDDEIRRLGVDSVSWRGAHFRAVLVPADVPPVT
jgi:hypothetical protein